MSRSSFPSISPQQLSELTSKLGMTSQEQGRLSSAMKDPTFLSLLTDYVKEISDPALKAENDAMLRQMEQEAGGQQQRQTATQQGKPVAQPAASGSRQRPGRVEESKRQIRETELDLD